MDGGSQRVQLWFPSHPTPFDARTVIRLLLLLLLQQTRSSDAQLRSEATQRPDATPRGRGVWWWGGGRAGRRQFGCQGADDATVYVIPLPPFPTQTAW